ncbi:ATP-binding protein [bacterium]|nr:ATP-binding protein [bacterium]
MVGPRQVGKTFLLRELEKEIQSQGKSCRYFDLEQPSDMLALGASEKEHFDVLTQSGEVVLVDEFHLIKNLSKIFKAIHDSKHPIKIFASGSSALEMHKHLKESMAGRVIFNKIFPFSLEERLQDKNLKKEDMLIFGGLPGLLHCENSEEKIIELQDMIATYIQKDIKALIKEENIRAFNHLLVLLANYQGAVVVAANLSREIGLSKPTVEKYLEILSQTYICHTLTSFSKNVSNELKKSKKYYLYDLGIRNSIIKDFSEIADRPDAGVLKESFVYLSILKQLKPNMDVFFWRTKSGQEIDFVLVKNRVPFPVEVKSKLSSPEIPQHLKTFLDKYPNSPGAIIFNDSIRETTEYAKRPVAFLHWSEAETIPFLKNVI